MSLYERALRFQHLRLRSWQREALTWGLVVLSVLLALTGMVSPWAILVLPLLAAALLKAHDLLTVRLASGAPLPVGVRDERAGGADTAARRADGADPASKQTNGVAPSDEDPNSNEPTVQRTEGS